MRKTTQLFAGALCAAASLWAQAQTAPANAGQGFALEGAVIDSRSGNSLGVINERGDIATLFRAQKAMTFGILRAAGVSLEQLSPEVRARIERFATTNVDAFRAFSQGLDLKDQGRFTEARESFRRAAELDPGFGLAAEQQQSMPDITVSSALQMRAVMAAAAGAAVDRGKTAYVVDLNRALAALQAGQTVVTVPSSAATAEKTPDDLVVVRPGSADIPLGNQVVALSYTINSDTPSPLSLSGSNEWRGAEVRATSGQLERLSTAAEGLLVDRGGATVTGTGQATLSDGSVAYWGAWLSAPTTSATVKVSGSNRNAPSLGRVDYVLGEAPRAMPSSATGTFTPVGGSLVGVTGNIGVNFADRSVTLNSLGFQIGSQTFSNLNGATRYDPLLRSGGFSGNYSSGSCAGCSDFNATSSVFSGNFIGRNANGVVFSTILLTGGGGTASGVHLFTRP
jgi:hypothetical protein